MKNKPIIFTDLVTKKTIAITSTPYHPLMDSPEYINDYIIDKKLGDFHIHIVHGMLTDRSLGPERVQTLIDNITHTNADITFCGHIHTGFKTVCKDGKYFINPGSVVRTSASKAEMSRNVHVVLLEITDSIKITEIPLKTALPGNEVLTREHIVLKNKKKSISEFYNAEVESYKIEKSRNINDVLDDIMSKEGLSDDVKTEYQKRINEKKASLVSGILEQKDAWIKSIEMVNFQSHKYQKINLDRYMNLLVGESDNGKSAILRAIYWVYTGKPTGISFVRYGCDSTEVTIELGNGTKIKHYVSLRPSDKTKVYKNQYTITYPDGTEETGNTRLLPKVQELLGYCNFAIDEQQSLDINFMRQGEGWFLISDNVSSPQRAKTIGAIMNTSCVDACLKDCDKELKAINREITLNQAEIVKCDEEISTYEDLEEQKKNIEKVENLLNKIKSISEKKEKITAIKEKINSSKDKIKELNVIISELNKFDLRPKIDEIKSVLDKMISISKTQNKIINSKNRIDEQSQIINGLKNTETLVSTISNLQTKISSIIVITDNYTKLINANNGINNCNLVLDKKSDIEKLNSTIAKSSDISEKIQRTIEKKNKINECARYIRNIGIIVKECQKSEKVSEITDKMSAIINKYSAVNSKKEELVKARNAVKATNELIATTERNLKQIEEYRQEYLSEFDICPICGQSVEHHNH